MVSGIIDQHRSTAFDEDLVLVDRVLEGDEEAFQTLYARYNDKVYAIAKGIVLDADEASDTVQEIFTLVFRKLNRFDRRARFSTWLFRISVNRSIQQARKLKHSRAQVPLTEAAERIEDTSHTPAPDPEVGAALHKMHPQDRAVLTLFYWDELSLQEIGESIGCSPNAAKTRLFRARERFRVQYEEEIGR